MVKGMTKRIVEIKETGSNYFEKAIFFVKMDSAGNVPEYTLTQEAMKIIDRLCSDLKIRQNQKRHRLMGVLKLCCVAAAGMVAGALIMHGL